MVTPFLKVANCLNCWIAEAIGGGEVQEELSPSVHGGIPVASLFLIPVSGALDVLQM